MKILLLGFNVQEDIFPLGLFYLKGYAQKFHPDVDIEIKEFSFGTRSSYDTNKNIELQALSYIMLQKPDVVAFSCYIWSGEMVQDFARAIKQINPHIKIILGGVEVHQDLLTENVDFIVNGEGEVAFKEIIDYLKGERKFEDIHNINNHKTIEIENLDDLPFPYKYADKKDHKVVRIETSRGCLFHCNFCHYAQGKLRNFSLEYLNENLQYLFHNFQFRNLTLIDANFNSDKNRMFAVLDMIEKFYQEKALQDVVPQDVRLQNVFPQDVHHQDELHVHCEFRPELLDKDIIKKLETYSFNLAVELGFQSSDEEVLKLANRPTNLEKVKEVLALLNKSTIKYKIDLMYGLPGDNFYKFLNSCRFLLQYATRNKKITAHHHMVLNNTTFHNDVERFNPHHSSMVLKTDTQDVLDLYLTKLFVDQLNEELKFS